MGVLLFFCTVVIVALVWGYKRHAIANEIIVEVEDIPAPTELPTIDYLIYTIDTETNYRFKNFANTQFPHQYGILTHQYIELSWQVINADWITISNIGNVQAVGKQIFYLTKDTIITITATNQEHTTTQTIQVNLFPVRLNKAMLVTLARVQSFEYKPITVSPKIDHTQIPMLPQPLAIATPKIIPQLQKTNLPHIAIPKNK